MAVVSYFLATKPIRAVTWIEDSKGHVVDAWVGTYSSLRDIDCAAIWRLDRQNWIYT